MIQKIIKPPMIDSLISNDHTTFFPQNNGLLPIGTKLETNYRTLIQFDLSSVSFFSTIISGTLNLFVAENQLSDTSALLGIFQVFSDWNPQTANSDEQPLVNSSPVDSIPVNNQDNTLLTFNVTPLLQDWFSNRSANMGLFLKFLDESHCNLLTIYGKNHRDSRFWPYLEVNIVNPAARELLRIPGTSLEQSVTVVAQDNIQCTLPLNILIYDFSYLAVNVGTNAAIAYLQVSPDGVTWETQSALKTINPGTLVSFVSNVIAKYARLCYQSEQPSNSTTLKIYIQGR